MYPRSPTLRAVVAFLASVLMAGTCAAEAPFNKASLAWTLPWDEDWVTAVQFVGTKRLVAGNKVGDILVWDLPEPAKPAPMPLRRLSGHTNSINRLLVTPDQRWLISAS